MSEKCKIVALSGSLRAASYNTASIKAAAELAADRAEIELLDISTLPLYNQELDGDHAPAAVFELAEKIRAADAVLFATPEYNYSIPGLLKNAIDWLSRQKPQPFAGKPAAIMSSSMGVMGGVRAQYHLRQILVYLDLHLVNKPEVMIGSAHQRFDEQGILTDETTREFVGDLVDALIGLSQQLQK